MPIYVTMKVIVDDNGQEIEPAEWRVAVHCCVKEEFLALPMVFGREQDAERAREALERAGLVDEAIIRQAGKSVVLDTMLNSMAW